DALLRARFQPGGPAVDAGAAFKAALRLHGQRRHPDERHLVVKLDSWHLAFHAELRVLYPDTPFVFLVREPGAVIRSQRGRPGMHALPGLLEPALFGLGEAEATALPWQDFLPRVLGFYYGAIGEAVHEDPRSLLLHYQPDMVPLA